MKTATLEMHEYRTLEEIELINGFRSDLPFEKSQYKSIIGEYHLLQKIKCCLKKENSICKHEHNHGFIVRLDSGAATIVGNVCANDNFDADSQFKKDRNALFTQKRLAIKHEKIKEILEKESELNRNIDEAETALAASQTLITNVSERFGEKIAQRLIYLANTGSHDIFVTLSNSRREDKPPFKVEVIKFKIKLGTISGCALFSMTVQKKLKNEIRNLRIAISNAKSAIFNPNKITAKKIDEISLSLDRNIRISETTDRLKRLTEQFENCKSVLFCYLTDDKSSRLKAARNYLESANLPAGKAHAKEFLTQHEQHLKSEYKADRLHLSELPYS